MLVTQPAPLFDRVRRARRRFGLDRLPATFVRWVACSGVIAVVLLVRNAYLFTTKVYEESDFAADTIAVLQAKHWTLLTGNYSRLGFYHPGPAFLYIEAWGEWLFHDVLHVVPTPWNGQLIAILLLNAALLGAALCLFAREGGRLVTIACLATVLAFAVLHPLTVNSNWMPYVYFAPTVLLLVSAAAVAAGRTTVVPLLCLAAGLCIHGQAEFLFFAPIVVLTALAGLFASRWRDPWSLLRPRLPWFGGLVIVLLFALPIVLNTVLNWPGELPEYFDYGARANGTLHHTAAVAVHYTLRFWWPGGPVRGALPAEEAVTAVLGFLLALVILALVLTCWNPAQRRFLLWSFVMVALMTVLFTYYAWRAIDEIDLAYEGYFFWSVPLLLLLVGAAAVTPRIQAAAGRLTVPLLGAALVAAAVAASVVPMNPDQGGPAQYFGEPAMPHDVAVLAAVSRGHPIVLNVNPAASGDAAGVIAYADRIGLRACVTQPRWTISFRAQSICTPSELRDGMAFAFLGSQQPPPRGSRLLFAMFTAQVYPLGPASR